MEKKHIIEKLQGIIEVTKGCISVTGDDEWNNLWIEEIKALNNAIKAVEENEKLQAKVTKALNALVHEVEKKTKIVNDKQELIEALCSTIELTRHHIKAANSYGAFNKAVEVVRKHITDPVHIETLRDELHECIDSYGLNDIRTVDKSQELDRALNGKEKLEREVVYFMKRSVQAEKLLKENECFCPALQRNEIRDFLRS